jgi:hypothetical protein
MRIHANFLSVVIYLKLCLTFWPWEKQILLLPLYNDSSHFAFKLENLTIEAGKGHNPLEVDGESHEVSTLWTK